MTTEVTQITERLSHVQSQIWQTVSHTMSEAANQPVTFGSTLVNLVPTSDIYAELTAPRLVLQFGFSDLPESSQVLLLPQELFTDLATLIRGVKPETIDDNLVAEIRQPLEAIVQGICVAVSEIKGTPTVATDLTIRFQIFSCPLNLQRAESLFRTDVAVTAEGVNGAVMWLMDPAAAYHALGETYEEDSAGVEGTGTPGQSGSPQLIGTKDDHGIEILLDIPLEISVELGRVRMLVKDIVELGSGSIVEIDKAAGEPVDIMVNGRLVARGEVVVIEDNFGVRITEILSPNERLQKLSEVA